MKQSRCAQTIDVNALEEEASASLDLDSLFGCTEQGLTLPEPKEEPGLLDRLASCVDQVDPKWVEAAGSDAENTSVSESSELLTSCLLGAMFAGRGGIATGVVGCGAAMLSNEVSEFAGVASGAADQIIDCMFGDDAP